MIIVLFLKGVQLAKTKNKFSEINFFNKNLNKKREKFLNKGKILIKLQKLKNK